MWWYALWMGGVFFNIPIMHCIPQLFTLIVTVSTNPHPNHPVLST